MGASLAHAGALSRNGVDVINYVKVIPTFLFIFLAPIIGMIIAFLITVMIVNICRKATPYKADKWFRRLQLVSSALFSLGHGGNDAQKVMGIIAAAMVAAGQLDDIKNVPDWVPFSCFAAIAIGTMSGGGKLLKRWAPELQK